MSARQRNPVMDDAIHAPAGTAAAEPEPVVGPSASTLVLRRFVGGTVGGVLQALTSHPLDTIKSRIQNGMFQTMGEGVRHTMAREGVRGFYKGVTPPLVLNGFYNALLFSINQQMTNIVTPSTHQLGDKLPLWRVALAGQMTAPLYCLAMVPMEVVKVKLQTQPQEAASRLYTGPVDCFRKNIAANGIGAAFVGYTPMLLSRLVGLPFYFGGYHTAKDALIERAGLDPHSMAVPMASGVVAGCCFWFSNYPFDFVKTKVQSSAARVSPITMAASIYKAGGVAGFYRGFTVCLLRSIPANSTVWLGVEFTTRFMANNGW